jgi:hypothetical protein
MYPKSTGRICWVDRLSSMRLATDFQRIHEEPSPRPRSLVRKSHSRLPTKDPDTALLVPLPNWGIFAEEFSFE